MPASETEVKRNSSVWLKLPHRKDDRKLECNIRCKEDADGGAELRTRQTKVFGQAGYSRISDIASIEVRYEVKGREKRCKSQVQLSEDLLFELTVGNESRA
ncbi:hypothetical protein CCHR01_00179 [Colletotrichum chrysophilum]|uniref:Uncharacterized protein n=1 Tax=Colletotrichum chrysophilum TaxID=1836956 RepID=A0AAD9B1A1_9PEZI|nr:hypothetical protein CCHR01_00179 [Colletotrichum chrysophilum]